MPPVDRWWPTACRTCWGRTSPVVPAGAGVDRAGAAAEGAGHESEVGLARGTASAVRKAELRGVGCIYGFQPKLQADALGELNGLGHGEVQVEESRPNHGIAANVADLLGSAADLIDGSGWAGRARCRRLAGRRGKRGWIKPRASTVRGGVDSVQNVGRTHLDGRVSAA